MNQDGLERFLIKCQFFDYLIFLFFFFFHHKRKQRMSEHFVQPHGIAMGTKMAVAFSVIFMADL